MAFLFVFGPARTGTSALTWELNSHGDIFLIPELNAAEVDAEGGAPTGQHFMRAYIDRVVQGPMALMLRNLHRFMPGSAPTTPAAVADFLEPFGSPDELLRYLAGFYRAVGTKVALFGHPYVVGQLYHYQERHHRDDLHIVTWRSPDAMIASAANLFATLPREQIIAGAATAYAASLDLIAAFPNRLILPAGAVTLAGLNTIRARIGLPPQPALNEIDASGVTRYELLEDARGSGAEQTLARLREIDCEFRAGLVWQGGVADLDRDLAHDLRARLPAFALE